jgi:hypothetical protein
MCAALAFPFTAFADAYDCYQLEQTLTYKKKFTELERQRLLSTVNALVDRSDICAKNILGKLLYDGELVEKDVDRAYTIFYDLASQSLPSASYNLAYLKAHDNKTVPEELMAFIDGLVLIYSQQDRFGKLAANARELGWDYLDVLARNGMPDERLGELRDKHQFVAQLTTNQLVDLTTEWQAKYREAITKEVVTSIAMIGAAVIVAYAMYEGNKQLNEAASRKAALSAAAAKSNAAPTQRESQKGAHTYTVTPAGGGTVMLNRTGPFGSYGSSPSLYNITPAGSGMAYATKVSPFGSLGVPPVLLQSAGGSNMIYATPLR